MNRLILQNNSSNWIDNIDEIVFNYNDTGHSAIRNIKPKDAFLDKRIKLSGKFRKGTDARYTDEVYTVTKVRGNTITSNNDEVYKKHHY